MIFTKQFIDKFLNLIKEEKGFTFEIVETTIDYNTFNKGGLELKLIHEDNVILKKVYNLQESSIDNFKSQFYGEIIKAFVGNYNLDKLLNN